MTAASRIILERLTGQIEGLSFCIENATISGALLNIAEAIDSVIKDESTYGGNNNDRQRTTD